MTISIKPAAFTSNPIEVDAARIISEGSINCWFQPIFNVRERRILGYEALARGPIMSSLHTPSSLFAAAQSLGLLRELEQQCVRTAIEQFHRLGLPEKLFINIAADDLDLVADRDHPIGSLLCRHARDIPIVLEISEKYPVIDYRRFAAVADYCRHIGVQLAIDDLGCGYSGLRTWAEIRPDYVKVDMHFVRDIHNDAVKREFVRSIAEIARGLNCEVIAEGVEQLEELNTLRNIGVRHAQGFLLQAPAESPPRSITGIRSLLDAPNTMPTSLLRNRPSDMVTSLIAPSITIAPNVNTEDVNDYFISHPDATALPVVENGKPVGIVFRNKLLSVFSGRFSYQLHGRKAIAEIMDTPVVVDSQARLDEVSRLITDKGEVDLLSDFVITDNGRYLGIGKVSELLRKITEQQVRYARYSNPLTLLPGNVPAYEFIDELLAIGAVFRVAYVDLNHFKPYNDSYGYNQGDEVIIALGDILTRTVRQDIDKVFHIGGDDFLVVYRSPDWLDSCRAITAAFDNLRSRFYCADALQEGGIWGYNRQGEGTFFNLLSIAIGVVWPDPKRCFSHHQVAQLASDAKKQAKLRDQHSHGIFLSRRRG